MTYPKELVCRGLFAAVGFFLACSLTGSPIQAAGSPDGVDLFVDRGPGPDDVILDWTGGQPTFEVFRSMSPEDVTEAINKLGETGVRTWDDTPPLGDIFFYYVKSPCIVDPPEVCDGVDNDCDGDIDEDYVSIPTTCGEGECEGNTGQTECVDGTEIDACDPYGGATPDICDGLDNDCEPGTPDGTHDPQQGTACDGGDTDLCDEGTLSCVAGTFVCSDNTGSTFDVCNGADDDCDPESDGSEDPDNGVACDGGDADLCEEGTFNCEAGTLVCSDNTSSTADLCNGADDDCDPASPDGSEDPQNGTACDGGDTDLCEEGILDCVAGTFVCSDNTGSTFDVCNGADDDCDPESPDGSEDPDNGVACDGGDADLCEEGTFNCEAGALVCSDNTSSTADLCNGADDDCDPASPDGSEDPQNGAACDGGDTDLCEEGILNCVAGAFVCSDNTGSTFDVCNGVDDDCDPASPDGSEDPDNGVPCDGADADSCVEGVFYCAGGTMNCSDNTSSTFEECNGEDDDCDGQTDEDFNRDNNPPCSTYEFLGSISGDTGGGVIVRQHWSERWYRLEIREDSDGLSDLGARIELWSAPGTDFDLFVYCDNCGGNLAGESTNGGTSGHIDVVEVGADDEFFGDDSFDIIIEVRHWESLICAEWELTVFGNMTVADNSCN